MDVDRHTSGVRLGGLSLMRLRPAEAARFGAEDLRALAGDGWYVDLEPRETIPLDGPWVTIVAAGYLRVYRHAAFIRDVTLFLAAAGDGLGLSRVLGERVVESGAEALGAARVLRLTPEQFETHALAHPDLYLRAARTLAARTLRVQDKIETYSRAGVEARIAGALLEMADDFGVATAGGIRLDLPIVQEDLARLAGTTRESASTTLADLGRRGIVRGRRLQSLVVPDRDALAELAAT